MGLPQRLEGAVQLAGGYLPESGLLGAARIDQVLGDGAALPSDSMPPSPSSPFSSSTTQAIS